MPATKSIEPACPQIIVGLSCLLPEGGGLPELVRKHFSPADPEVLPTSSAQAPPANPVDSIIHVIESAFRDAQIQVYRKTAVFLAPGQTISESALLSAGFKGKFQSAFGQDPTLMVLPDADAGISEALNWLDRGECEYALVAACELVESQTSAVALLLTCKAASGEDNAALTASHLTDKAAIAAGPTDEAAAAAAGKTAAACLRTYAGLEHAARQSRPGSCALLSVTGTSWLDGNEAARRWQIRLQKQSREPASADPNWTRNDSFCYVSSLALELSGGSPNLALLFALLTSALALHLRVIPGADRQKLQLDNSALLAQPRAPRPWIHPVSPVEPAHPRRCFVEAGADGYMLSEPEDDINRIALRSLQDQSSELFIYSGANSYELREIIARHAAVVLPQATLSLAGLAFQQNCTTETAPGFKLAIVAGSREELLRLAREAVLHLDTAPQTPLIQIGERRSTGIYYSGLPAAKPGQVVFVFPGLGAAYPQMLADLCFFFPEVRQVFDFVERLSLKAADKVIPSRAIFPVAGGSEASSQATLATMDSAVVTLLLAEWAIYLLLKNSGVKPDILLGCSTGEFAALTISEAANILDSAEIFYRLSTHVASSIPAAELSELRSIRVAAPCRQVILPLLSGLSRPVYVGADLSDSCVLLSGQKAAIEEFCKTLRREGIDYLPLPVAIPYHTPLVSGKISESDTQPLKMGAPKIETWSCSTGLRYPDDAAELRKISRELFEKPIGLHSTIQRLYEHGARVFVEVGPKGGLVPFISEILKDRDHIAIAANLAGKSGIDQFNALLAVLVCHGIDMFPAALYQRRVAPVGSGRQSEVDYNFVQNLEDDLSDEVMINYLASLQQFHTELLATQERVLAAYLSAEESPDSPSFLSGDFAFLPASALQSAQVDQDSIQIRFCLNTTQQPFLADHAIGGSVTSSGKATRVCLVPLMVTLEVMAEGASLLFPDLHVTKLSDIRAYKRIRVSERDLELNLHLSVQENNTVAARIILPAVAGRQEELLAYCLVELAADLPASQPSPVWDFSKEDSRSSQLSPHKLYGRGSMFHGPSMQSVESIDRVARRVIEGRIACRDADGWFAEPGQQAEPRAHQRLAIDPLLLDNASQFVLYQMFEHGMPVSALLPFHVGAIEFYSGYHELCPSTVCAAAILRSMTLHGTEAQIQLADSQGRLVARVDDISSRAIVLTQKLRDFVEEPAGLLAEIIKIAAAPQAVVTGIARDDLPEDDTSLDWLTDYILTNSEQSEWRKSGRTEKRRLERLMGRIAAKDAVRTLVQKEMGIALKAADIEISNNESGQAQVSLPDLKLPWIPQISISHCNTVAVAIAEPPQENRQSGIDVEEVVEKEAGFAELAFTPAELNWLESRPAGAKPENIIRLWTAKEAAAKACGSGLSGNPRLFELVGDTNAHSIFKIRAGAKNMEPGRAYSCLVSTEAIPGVSLAIVIGSPELAGAQV